MPTSYYASFEVKIDNDDGSVTLCPLQTVNVYDVDHAVALADLMTDANGIVDSGSLAVDPETLIRFSFTRPDGICGYSEVFTSASPPTFRMAAKAPEPETTILDQTRGSGV
jgi:hypothetical protein